MYSTLNADIEHALDLIPADFGGGCSVGKAQVMARLIVEHDIDLAVEVGVYRGRSFIPLALAMRARGGGRAVGVDPYSAAEAMQYDEHLVPREQLHEFAQATDWDAVMAGVEDAIARDGLAGYAELMRATSVGAAPRFADSGIGLLHIDGNHDRAAVEGDIARWLPSVRAGGFLVLDDASWPSVIPSIEALRLTHELVLRVNDNGNLLGAGPSDFAVLRVPDRAPPAPSPPAAAPSRGLLERLASRVRR